MLDYAASLRWRLDSGIVAELLVLLSGSGKLGVSKVASSVPVLCRSRFGLLAGVCFRVLQHELKESKGTQIMIAITHPTRINGAVKFWRGSS